MVGFGDMGIGGKAGDTAEGEAGLEDKAEDTAG